MCITVKRLETEEEKKAKAYVHWKAWQETYAGLVEQRYLDTLTLEKCEGLALRFEDSALIARDGQRTVGFISYGPYRGGELSHAAEVYAIYILAEYYGQGVGYRLMQAALAELKGYPQIAVWVLRGNERAIRFYVRCGFRFDGREQIITLGTQKTELRMVLER